MISKNQIKQIRALGQKKQRKQQQLFLVQGEKNVLELLNSKLRVKEIFATPEFIENHQASLDSYSVTIAEQDQLAKASTLISNNAAIAIVELPSLQTPPETGLILALDDVSDPGNLGTIIRVADWYGFSQLVLGRNCADPYSPKTISATMGSFTRVSVSQLNLCDYLEKAKLPTYGAYLGGESVHKAQFKENMILIMGSESHGISDDVGAYINHKITIPSFGHAESLNVAMATGIILDNIKRVI